VEWIGIIKAIWYVQDEQLIVTSFLPYGKVGFPDTYQVEYLEAELSQAAAKSKKRVPKCLQLKIELQAVKLSWSL